MHLPDRAAKPGHGQVDGFTVRRSFGATAPLLLCQVWLTGCPPPGAQRVTEGTTAIEATSGSGSTGSDSTGSGSSSPTEAPTSAAETTPAGSCLDGALGEGEDCDDGNHINGDGCNNDCRPSGVQLFEYRPDDRGSTQVRSIAADADGSIVVGGLASGLQRWVARFGPDLAPQWTKTYGDGSTGLVRSVALAGGAIYAAGALLSDGDGRDIWVARLGSDGTLEWEDGFSGGAGDDWLTQAMAVEGDVVVTGMALGDQIWTRRYGADGAVQWTATAQLNLPYTNLYPLGPGLAAADEFVVLGWTAFKSKGVSPELLLAYPSGGGEPSWTAELPGTAGVIQAIAVDPGGDLVLAVDADFADLTVRRVTAAGELVWSSADCSGRSARDVVIDSQGDIIVIGDGPANGGANNIRLCKFAADGTLRWGKDIDGGFGGDLGYAVAVDPADRVIAGGAMSDEQDEYHTWLAVFSP